MITKNDMCGVLSCQFFFSKISLVSYGSEMVLECKIECQKNFTLLP